ncbi:MAG: ATP synthase F0 subunit B, partial [Collinsella intestinalis]
MKNVKSAGIALGAAASVLFTPALAFAEGTESGGVDILIPKIAEFIPALVIFLIIWFLLSKFVWPKVISVLDAREHKIEDSLEQADATRPGGRDSRSADAIVAGPTVNFRDRSRGRGDAKRAFAVSSQPLTPGQDTCQGEDRAGTKRSAYMSATDYHRKMSVAVATSMAIPSPTTRGQAARAHQEVSCEWVSSMPNRPSAIASRSAAGNLLRTLLEAAKTENRVLENIEPHKADANASPEVLSVLSQMAANGDLDKLGAVLDLYSEMAEGDEATVGVTVTTAVPLDNELRMLVTQKCELDLGRNVF